VGQAVLPSFLMPGWHRLSPVELQLLIAGLTAVWVLLAAYPAMALAMVLHCRWYKVCIMCLYLVITAPIGRVPCLPLKSGFQTQCGSPRQCFYLVVLPVGNVTLVLTDVLTLPRRL